MQQQPNILEQGNNTTTATDTHTLTHPSLNIILTPKTLLTYMTSIITQKQSLQSLQSLQNPQSNNINHNQRWVIVQVGLKLHLYLTVKKRNYPSLMSHNAQTVRTNDSQNQTEITINPKADTRNIKTYYEFY